MKISEVKNKLEEYDEPQLRTIILDVYRKIPKAVRDDKNVDFIIEYGKAAPKQKEKLPDFEDLTAQIEEFIEDAKDQLYFAPNRKISKKQRSGWRFVVKRLYRNIIAFTRSEQYAAHAAELFEKLYLLLCYSCDYHTFNTFDTFETIKTSQEEFYDQVLTFNECRIEQKPEFIRHSIKMILENGLNRYTLYTTLFSVLIQHLKTVDMKERAIKECGKLIDEIKSIPPKAGATLWSSDRDELRKERKLENLAILGLFCYSALYEYESGINYFNAQYPAEGPFDEERKLYVLLSHMLAYKRPELFCKVYEGAVSRGITPRESLVRTYDFVKSKGELPDYFLQ